MTARKNIVLVGFMGTGKTTVGRMVSEQLGRPLLDVDAMVEQRAGKSIPRIFSEDGESTFRRLERDMVSEVSRRDGAVITPGGGVVLNPENMRNLAERGVVICLWAAPDVILRRVEAQSHRPLLEQGNKARQILELLASRRALYEAVPYRIDTSLLAPEEVAARVLALYQAADGQPV